MPKEKIKKTSSNSASERAMSAAAHCFSQKGIENTSMDDIASQAEMARSTLYRYFKDKDRLIIEVMEQEAFALARDLSARIKTDNFGDYIIQGMLLAVENIPQHPVLGKMFAPETLATSSRVMLMTNHLSQVAIEVVSPAIEHAKKEGVLRNALSAEMLMDWLVRIIFSLIATQSDANSSPEKTKKLLETMLLPALLND